MKKIVCFLFALAAVSFAVAGCSSDNDDNGDGGGPAGVEDGAYTGTVTVDQDDDLGTIYTQDDVKTAVTFGDDGSATIEIFKVAFSDDMPVTLDIKISGVTATPTAGGFSLSGDNIIPTAMGGPFPMYTIKNMTGKVTENSLTFEMMCGRYPTKFEGVKKAE